MTVTTPMRGWQAYVASGMKKSFTLHLLKRKFVTICGRRKLFSPVEKPIEALGEVPTWFEGEGLPDCSQIGETVADVTFAELASDLDFGTSAKERINLFGDV